MSDAIDFRPISSDAPIDFKPIDTIDFKPEPHQYEPEVEPPTITMPTGGIPSDLQPTQKEPTTIGSAAKAAYQAATKPMVEIGARLGVTPQTLADAVETVMAYKMGMQYGASPAEVQRVLGDLPQREPGAVEKVAAGAQQAVVNSLDFFTSPLGIATLGTSSLPAAGQKAVAGLFVADMARHAPEQVTALAEAVVEGDPEKISETATGLALTGAFIYQGGKHAVGGKQGIAAMVDTLRKRIKPAPEAPPVPDAAKAAEAVGPATAEAVKPEAEAAARELVKETLPESLPPEKPAQPSIKAIFTAKGATDILYQKIFDAAKEGRDTVAGIKDPLIPQARALIESGAVKTWRDLKDWHDGKPAPAPEPRAPEFVGMGGAVPKEFERTRETATALKNEVIEKEAVELGLDPLIEKTRVSNPELWGRAMAMMDREPGLQDRLISELTERPRAVSPEEDFVLLHRQIELRNEYAKATKELFQAKADNIPELAESMQIKVDAMRGQLDTLYNIVKAVGTEQGRALQARKQLVYEDFTFAGMERQLRAAKGGEALTDEQARKVKELSEQIEKLNADYETKIAKAKERIAELEEKAQYDSVTLAFAEKVAKFMDTQADAARARLREKMARTSAGIDPTILSDVAIIGAAKLTRGVVEFAKWTDEMARDAGEWVREHAKEAYEASKKAQMDMLDSYGKPADKPVKEKARKLLKGRIERQIAEYERRIAEKDYEPKKREKRTVAMDKDAMEAAAKLEALKVKFRNEVAQETMRRWNLGQKAADAVLESWNILRNQVTSMDLSAVLRQGFLISLANPRLVPNAMRKMIEAAVSEERAMRIEQEIAHRPNAQSGQYARSTLRVVSLNERAFTKQEEAIRGRWANRVPWIRASNRAFVTYLNVIRTDAYDSIWRSTMNKSPEAGRAAASLVNMFSGYGDAGKYGQAVDAASHVLWSPRLLLSRIEATAGKPLWSGPKEIRMAAAREYGKALAGIAVIYMLARAAGYEPEVDPRSSDFGKLRDGNTRIDPLAGFAQTWVLTARLITGEKVTGSGRVQKLYGKDVGYGQDDAWDVAGRFLRTKLTPFWSTFWDLRTGKDVAGRSTTFADEAAELVTPLSARDILPIMEEQGIPKGVAIEVLSLLGVGVQHYGSEPKRSKPD